MNCRIVQKTEQRWSVEHIELWTKNCWTKNCKQRTNNNNSLLIILCITSHVIHNWVQWRLNECISSWSAILAWACSCHVICVSGSCIVTLLSLVHAIFMLLNLCRPLSRYWVYRVLSGNFACGSGSSNSKWRRLGRNIILDPDIFLENIK